jgi:hypothetical protein
MKTYLVLAAVTAVVVAWFFLAITFNAEIPQ